MYRLLFLTSKQLHQLLQSGKAGFHTTPRTASGTRTIPILYPQVAEQLRALIEVMDALYPEDLVMSGYHGFLLRNRSGYFLSAHNIDRAIERISVACNAEEMDQAELIKGDLVLIRKLEKGQIRISNADLPFILARLEPSGFKQKL